MQKKFVCKACLREHNIDQVVIIIQDDHQEAICLACLHGRRD